MPQDKEKSYCKPKDGKDQTNGKSEAKRNGTVVINNRAKNLEKGN